MDEQACGRPPARECLWAIARATNSRRGRDPDERFPGKRALTARGPAAGSGLRCRRLLAVDSERAAQGGESEKHKLIIEARMPRRDARNVARLSDNSERLYESDNGVLGRPHRSAASGRSGASETEMTQFRIDSLSLMYKKSPDPVIFRQRPGPARRHL
jgi:hypothetical protein